MVAIEASRGIKVASYWWLRTARNYYLIYLSGACGNVR